jgi:dTDP-4-dehydrorhamnose 3,5-epimerase
MGSDPLDETVLVNVDELSIPGVFVIHGHRRADSRGEFRKVLEVSGLSPIAPLTVVEVAMSTNRLAGTLRGLHYQVHPHAQAKTIWLNEGALFDVVVDIRPSSITYGEWAAIELTAASEVALHVPRGVAHGFQTLEDNTVLTYLMDGQYAPASARTLRWDDAYLNIAWPMQPTNMSDTDRSGASWPPFS